MGDFIRMVPQATLQQFHAFRDERPKEEKWELIAGVPHMMPPPRLVHQRIAANLELSLNIRLQEFRPTWRADREIGLLLPEDDKYNPEPDVTVTDIDIGLDQIYATQFYFVAEVLSPSDKRRVLDLKLEYYQGHDLCRGVMFVEPDRIEAVSYNRTLGGWQELKLATASDRIAIPDIGDIGSLCQLYRHTPLWRPEFGV